MVDLSNLGFRQVSNGLDPVGLVFTNDRGIYYRGLFLKSEKWLKSLIELDVFSNLHDCELIPHQDILSSDDPTYTAVMASKAPDWIIHPAEYPLGALRDAAHVWIEINQKLHALDSSLGLIDGHYGNFALFRNSRPKWIDMGSIQPLRSATQGIPEFIRYFINPLVIISRKPALTQTVRDRIRNPKGGITNDEVAAMTETETGVEVDLTRSRLEILEKLLFILADTTFENTGGFWSNYRQSEALVDAANGNIRGIDPRPRQVRDLINSLGPNSMIDIGANDGLYSIIASKEDRTCLAADLDELALNKLYEFLKEQRQFPITVARRSFTGLSQRADVVLALALTHHLFLTQKLSFGVIAKKLASMSSKAVITEYMPDGLGGTRTQPNVVPNPLPSGYSLDDFLLALRRHFEKVKVIDYGREVQFSRRTMILCEGPIE